MKTTHTILAALLGMGVAAYGQVEPAATGPSVPITGNLQFSAQYAQAEELSNENGNWDTSTVSADATYTNNKPRAPFAMQYAGGYTWTLQGLPYAQGVFQHLSLSQGGVWHKWNASVSDDVSYRPAAPTIGFSGVAGTGEPVGGGTTSQTILTVNTHTVDNLLQGSVAHQVNYATTISVGGGSELLRYPNDDGVDTNTVLANAGVTRRLSARTSLLGSYVFSDFSYPNGTNLPSETTTTGSSTGFNFLTNQALFGFKRQWTQKVSTFATAGPLWTESGNASAVPSIAGLAVNAVASYEFRRINASVSYNRGINGGGGYLPGAKVDAIYGTFSKDFGRNFNLGFTGAYMRTDALQGDTATNSRFGGAQASRRLGRFVNLFASYTAIDQISSSSLPYNTLNGFLQVFSGGIAYSPRETRLRH
jgi:hypothetical protein